MLFSMYYSYLHLYNLRRVRRSYLTVSSLLSAYEEEDELLWSPGTLPENKVRSFLSEALSRTTDERTGCDKPGIHVRDNEQVSALL